MTDGTEEIRAFLLTRPAIIALVGQQIVCDTELPDGYSPDDEGPLLLLTARGGSRRPNSPMRERTTFARSYAADSAVAAVIDATLAAELHGKAVAGMRVNHVGEGQPGQEPEVLWPFVISIYRSISIR